MEIENQQLQNSLFNQAEVYQEGLKTGEQAGIPKGIEIGKAEAEQEIWFLAQCIVNVFNNQVAVTGIASYIAGVANAGFGDVAKMQLSLVNIEFNDAIGKFEMAHSEMRRVGFRFAKPDMKKYKNLYDLIRDYIGDAGDTGQAIRDFLSKDNPFLKDLANTRYIPRPPAKAA